MSSIRGRVVLLICIYVAPYASDQLGGVAIQRAYTAWNVTVGGTWLLKRDRLIASVAVLTNLRFATRVRRR